jgi:hypothetical protein
MAQSEKPYKLTLRAEGINVDKVIDEDIARQVLLLIMGGEISTPLGKASGTGGGFPQGSGTSAKLSAEPSLTPKVFMAEKKPASDVERIACLAYYLSRHRQTPAFKTRDLTSLNTEAAQRKLSNAAFAARNAVTQEYLSLAGGGKKQITVRGEALVEALPDRDRVKEALATVPAPKRRKLNKIAAKKGAKKAIK